MEVHGYFWGGDCPEDGDRLKNCDLQGIKTIQLCLIIPERVIILRMVIVLEIMTVLEMMTLPGMTTILGRVSVIGTARS